MLDGRAGGLRADTADMVAARLRVHAAGVLDAIVESTAEALVGLVSADHTDPLIVDLGGGPGSYLRACMRRLPQARGVVLDLSKYCARAVMRGEPPAAAVVADVWRAVPLRDSSVTAALSVFAPRNIAETARVLRDDGLLLIVSPLPDHLRELVGPLGMLTVAPGKQERLDDALHPDFEIVDRCPVRSVVPVTADVITDLVAMGPSAFHHDRSDIEAAVAEMTGARGDPVEVTCAVTITVCRPVSR